MSRDERGPWYLLTGLILGIGLGLAFAWVVQPVNYVDTAPDSLRSDYKDQYRALIAAAYLANNDLLRAEARLKLLKDEDMYRTLAEQAQRSLAQDSTSSEARALGVLAIALGQGPPGPGVAITQARLIPTQTLTRTVSPEPSLPATMTTEPSYTTAPTLPPPSETAISVLPAATDTPVTTSATYLAVSLAPSLAPMVIDSPAVTRTYTAAPSGPFVLLSQEQVCTPELAAPLLQVEAMGLFGQPEPGVLVIVSWDSQEERFYTGLKPEKGLGYADFTLAPGKVYTVRLGEGGQPVSDLAPVECTRPGGGKYWGAWLLRFSQP